MTETRKINSVYYLLGYMNDNEILYAITHAYDGDIEEIAEVFNADYAIKLPKGKNKLESFIYLDKISAGIKEIILEEEHGFDTKT